MDIEILIYDNASCYAQDDEHITALLGNKKRQAQLRYYNRAPEHFKIGNKIFYLGSALNDFITKQMQVCNAGY